MSKCIFAGTFDPFTVGHEDTVSKCLKLFDEVVIAVAENRKKQCLFSSDDRLAFINAVYANEPRVRATVFGGVIVDLLKAEHTPFYVRGVRNTIDFEYENADFFASRELDKEMITLYIPAEQDKLHVSSTLVKNCIAFGKPFGQYLPENARGFIRELLQKRGYHV